jgi:hypothetical protein
MKKKTKTKNKESKINLWKKEEYNIIFDCVFAVLALLIIILFYDRIFLATILQILLGVVGLIKWNSKITFRIYLFSGIFGALAESLVITYARAWEYTFPNILNIPIWLFFLWGNAGAFIYEIAKEIKKLRGNRERKLLN